MAIEKREQVFISSTFKDLEEERRAVIQTLLEADCIPAGMELFPASDSEKWELIKRVIDLCDYYVVIVGGRYGSMDAVEQLSYTEMEFDYAVRSNKPVMGFLHGDTGKLPGDKLDLDSELREKLDAFREKVEKKMVKYWQDPSGLAGQVAIAVMQARKSHPAVGWIRASEAMTPEVKQELVELRAKVRELSAQLHEEHQQSAGSLDQAKLMQGDETSPVECVVDFHWLSDIEAERTHLGRRRRRWTVELTWDDVFGHLGSELMGEASEDHLRDWLSGLCYGAAREDLMGRVVVTDEGPEGDAADEDESQQDDSVERIYDVKVTKESFNDVKVQLSALGLIEMGTKNRPASDSNTYWRLTDRGSQYLLHLRAVRKPEMSETMADAPEESSEGG